MAVSDNTGCLSVLVVEDDAGIRDTLRIFLELEGYTVLTAANGRQGIEALKSAPALPGLILLDLMMPVMNGWEFVEAVRQDSGLAAVPIVIITAYGDQAHAVPATEVIKKPIDLDLLLKTVRERCDSPGGDPSP